jgi:hypothetical protein
MLQHIQMIRQENQAGDFEQGKKKLLQKDLDWKINESCLPKRVFAISPFT